MTLQSEALGTVPFRDGVIGVDGCAGGWIAASRDASGVIRCWRIEALDDLFKSAITPTVVAVDVPIGLLERGARACDVEARRLLGPRRTAVFPAPIRPLLTARSHAGASEIRYSVEGKRVSIQAWAIVPKIIEVDDLLHSDEERRNIVREVHPEVSFFFLNGKRPISTPKRKSAGRAERISLLQKWGGEGMADAVARRPELGCKPDDVVDAIVALWTAERIARGHAVSIPSNPPTDGHGLKMEMLA